MTHWKLKYAITLVALWSALLVFDISNPFFSNESGHLEIEEFAGSYILGDVESGARNILLVQNDWTFVWDYGFGRFGGTLMWDGTKIILEIETEGAITDSLVPVMWGERRYLVPIQIASFFSDEVEPYNDQLGEFCARIESGEEPRDNPYGDDYLLHGHWEIAPTGVPMTSWGLQVCR